MTNKIDWDTEDEFAEVTTGELRRLIAEAEQACEDMQVAPEVVEALLDKIDELYEIIVEYEGGK